ncbi:MAG: hypothetical protein OIF32_02680 [Campylobacterales bacterium]|nr:hypothetical protein [Campylobacterales bacterium]
MPNLLKKIKSKICERGQKCSCFIDRMFKWDWSNCCEEHDKDYIQQRTATKEIADKKFYKCLVKKAPKWIAKLMYSTIKKSKISKGYWEGYKKNKS